MCELDGTRVEEKCSLIPFEPMGVINKCIRRYFQRGSQNNNEI